MASLNLTPNGHYKKSNSPKEIRTLNRIRRIFAYYTKWMPEFSAKIHNLVKVNWFPLNKEAFCAFESLKIELYRATLLAIEENLHFMVDFDASDNAIPAV